MTMSDTRLSAMAEAVMEADSLSDLGHWQTVRDMFAEKATMEEAILAAVHNSGYEYGDDPEYLAREIAEQVGNALADLLFSDIHGQINELLENDDVQDA